MSIAAAVIAVLVGVVVFVISQFVLKLILEPLVCVRRTIADVSSTVLFYQAKITNAAYDDAIAEKLWHLSSRLRADVYVRFS
jgi:hypothetical protein